MFFTGRCIDVGKLRNLVPISGRLPDAIDFLCDIEVAGGEIARLVPGEIDCIPIIGEAWLQFPSGSIDIRSHGRINAWSQIKRGLPLSLHLVSHPDIEVIGNTG
jgi:hypothetical protein